MVVSLIYKLGNMTMQELLAFEFSQKVTKPQAVIAVQVYLELVELKKYYSVNPIFNETVNKMIIVGKKWKDAPMCAFIPISTTEHLDFLLMNKYMKCHQYPKTCLVFVAPDTTTVYYEIEEGLIPYTEDSKDEHRVEKRRQLNRDLEKYREYLEEAALLATNVIIPGVSAQTVTPMEVTEEAPGTSTNL